MDYTKLSNKELKDECKKQKIKGYSKLKKEEIIKLLEENKEEENKEEENKEEENKEEENKEEENNIILNNYYIEDNIDFLQKIKDNSINLIYFDPPYNTGRNFYNFNDKFNTKEEYIEFIDKRVKECFRILKKTGSLIIHIEPKISHYFRIICDKYFGDNNFKNEIIWQTGGNSKNKYQLNRYHDTILVYSKSSNQVFNPIYFPYNNEYKKKSNVKMCEIYNKEYVTTAIHNSQPDVNPRLNLRYEWKGNTKQWYITKEKMEELHKTNRLVYNENNIPRIKRFLDEMEGIPLRDIWTDINNVQLGEKVNYATQKPVKLLERIIKLYSNENDICIDIFAGSGTLGRASINLNRKYILCDINLDGKKIFNESIK